MQANHKYCFTQLGVCEAKADAASDNVCSTLDEAGCNKDAHKINCKWTGKNINSASSIFNLYRT